MSANSRRRVKLYVLNGERWVDHGTGYVSTLFMDDDKQQKGIVLLVRSEEDGKVILQSKIEKDTVYEKQGDSQTLVVWAEADDHLALSFQEEEGCAEIWEKICQVQQSDYYQRTGEEVEDATFEEVQEAFEEVPFFSIPIELPACELSKLDEISELFHSVFASAEGREKLACALEENTYVTKLTDLFHICEDLENLDGLHTLFEIFKLLFLLEKHSLFEMMFHADNILDVVGILEYDPTKKDPMRHREFLTEKVNYKEVIPIHNVELLKKIHLTYRIQYIKDILVPVPSLFDENMSALGSYLLFSKIEIVELIQQDSRFIEELFNKLTDDEISDDKRKEALCLLRELVNFSQSLQNENRIIFIKSLSSQGLLQSLEQLMNIDDVEIRSVIVDIICCIVECTPSLVRDYLCKEGNTLDEDSMLLNMLIEMLLSSAENEMGVILMQLIRNLLDPENMGLGNNKMEKSEFLGFFYRHCMHVLTAPLFAVTTNDSITDGLTGKDDFNRATVLDYIIDILTFCVEHHSYHIKNYVISKDMLRRVLALMLSKHKFLGLAALKFLRRIVGIKDELYNRYITVGKLMHPVVKAFLVNGQRYNLVNSAIIELFEFIRMENITTLCTYIVEHHIDAFKEHSYVETFNGLKTRYEQEKDRTKSIAAAAEREEKDANALTPPNTPPKNRRDDRVLDEYEENWFENDDEEIINDTTPPPASQTPSGNDNDARTHGGVTPSTNDNDAHNPGGADNDTCSTKPLSAKLKDVDLIDTIPVTATTASPPSSVASHSPLANKNVNNNINNNNNNTNNGTSQNNRPGTPCVARRPLSPSNQSTNEKQAGESDNLSSPKTPSCFPMMKQLSPLNKKGVKNIVINTNNNNNNNNTSRNNTNTTTTTNNTTDNQGANENLVNGSTGPVVADKLSSAVETATAAAALHHETVKGEIQVTSLTSKTKAQLTSLVDYPDDDEESDSTDEEEIPSSPAKKQRIGST